MKIISFKYKFYVKKREKLKQIQIEIGLELIWRSCSMPSKDYIVIVTYTSYFALLLFTVF